MVEGPGHVPFDQIEYNMKLQRQLCHGAPFYVLGPLVTDIFPGYDHITSCIGATAAGYHGASMLCYVTPKEHLGLPKKDDVKQGCIAYKIAAHASDVALGIPGSRDRDDELTKARAALNWEKHFELSFDPDLARAFHDEDLDVDTDFCAMCGHDWCSVRISKEIVEFASGKAEGFEQLEELARALGGAVAASAVKAGATGLRLGAGATTPKIRVEGSVKAAAVATDAVDVRGVQIDSGASVDYLANSGVISAAITGTKGSATAILDAGGRHVYVSNLPGPAGARRARSDPAQGRSAAAAAGTVAAGIPPHAGPSPDRGGVAPAAVSASSETGTARAGRS